MGHPNYSPAESAERFWRKVEKTPDCWIWAGAKTDQGYGYLIRGGRHVLAHRFAFAATYGPIPAGLVICHVCDVRSCVRPEHLALGTQVDNMADMAQKGRARMVRAQRGEANKVARLTEASVREIRSLSAEGHTLAALSRRYAVDARTIWHVVQRKTWAHVV